MLQREQSDLGPYFLLYRLPKESADDKSCCWPEKEFIQLFRFEYLFTKHEIDILKDQIIL